MKAFCKFIVDAIILIVAIEGIILVGVGLVISNVLAIGFIVEWWCQ